MVEYTGEVIPEKERWERMMTARKRGAVHFYIMELSKGLYIDAEHNGSNARFMNSSCDPNCETQKWKDASTGVLSHIARCSAWLDVVSRVFFLCVWVATIAYVPDFRFRFNRTRKRMLTTILVCWRTRHGMHATAARLHPRHQNWSSDESLHRVQVRPELVCLRRAWCMKTKS